MSPKAIRWASSSRTEDHSRFPSLILMPKGPPSEARHLSDKGPLMLPNGRLTGETGQHTLARILSWSDKGWPVDSPRAGRRGGLMEEKPRVEKVGAVEYEHVGREYLQDRALERRAGVALIWGLGVGYVISGEFFSWNFGFAGGGFGGFLIASFLAVAMYVFMVYGISEMATAFPVTGGPYAFARRTMGVWGGFATGIGAILEYVLATSTLAVAIAFNLILLPPLDHLPKIVGLAPIEWLAILVYAIFMAINLAGVQATLWSVFGITVASVIVLLLWGTVMLAGGHWEASNFTNI